MAQTLRFAVMFMTCSYRSLSLENDRQPVSTNRSDNLGDRSHPSSAASRAQ